MPLRVIGYDGAEYRAQLTEKNNAKSRYPVIMLVLYFGHTKPWGKPKNLLDRLDIPEKLKPYVSDYKMNLFEIAHLSREQVNLFKSDFRVVADYLVQMREKGDYIPEPQELRHVQETLQLLSVMTGDHRFEETYDDITEGRPHNMCDVLDRIESKGMQQGIQQGIQQGRTEREAQIILNMYQKKLPLEQIAELVGISLDEVKTIVENQKTLLS